jgi:hypothetical protein
MTARFWWRYPGSLVEADEGEGRGDEEAGCAYSDSKYPWTTPGPPDGDRNRRGQVRW